MSPFRVAAVALAASLALAGAPAQAGAQTVVQLEGGGSSLVDGYGLTANVWRPGSDGWVGIGYLDGLRIGAFLRTGVGKDTLRIGNDALQIRFPTDVFSGGRNLLVQGVSWTGGTSRGSYAVFGGASSSGLGAQSFQPTSVERPLGAIFLQRRVSPTVRLTGTAIVAERQTVIPGHRVAADAGHRHLGRGRRRCRSPVCRLQPDAPPGAARAQGPIRLEPAALPARVGADAESDGDRPGECPPHLRPDARVSPWAWGARTSCRTRRMPTPAIRAAGNSIFAGGRLSDWRVTAGTVRLALAGHRQPQLLPRTRPRGEPLARRRAVRASEPA